MISLSSKNFPQTTSSRTWRLRYACLLATLSMLITCACGNWPEIYRFAAPTHIAESPVHLSDDVMITLRAGYMTQETGKPAFNRQDTAQPSTSYLSPYLYLVFASWLPPAVSTAIFALTGLISIGATAACITWFSRSITNAALIVMLLALTKTNLEYGLNGWDHLFQGLCLTYATCLAIQQRAYWTRTQLLSIGMAAAGGALFRPDGIIISIAILATVYASTNDKIQFLTWAITPFTMIMGITLGANALQFHTLTPTTARLKIGASPSIEYTWKYFWLNGLKGFSALTVFLVLGIASILHRRHIIGTNVGILLAACITTAGVSFYNSDVFPWARMYWAPTCVFAATILSRIPNLLKKSDQVAHANPRRSAFITLATASLMIFLLPKIITNLNSKVMTSEQIKNSPTAQQFMLTKWIDEHLQPNDGAIGFFFLGVSYHLPRFEVADFLGKADEMIALTPVKWGPPGHNKWDIDKTMAKWNLQAIIPPAPSDRRANGLINAAAQGMAKKQDFAFHPDLILNNRIDREFSYCYLKTNRIGYTDTWGFFLRRAISLKHATELNCSHPPNP